MSTWHKVGCCLIAAVAAFGAFADGESAVPEIREGQLWTYDASTKWLTEIVGEGVTPWKFKLTDAGVICEKTSGANKTVDLRAATMPENAPAIVMIDDEYTSHWKVRTDSTCEMLFLPESLTNLTGHVFFQWTALKRVEFPLDATEFSLVDGSAGMFNGSQVTNVVLPQALKSIPGGQFQRMAKLKYIRLPDNLEVLGDCAFQDDSALTQVEPLLPRPLTYFGGEVFRGTGSVGGDLELGFGTNEVDHTPIMVRRDAADGRGFWGCGNVTSVRLGPGVRELYYYDFLSCGKLTYIEVGCNVTNLTASFPAALKRLVFKRTEDFSVKYIDANQNGFIDCKNLTEVEFAGWCEYPESGTACPFRNWSAKQARFLVPLTNAKWQAYFSNPSKVTPWRSVSAADRTSYYTKYGAGAVQPVGLSVAVANGLNSTWIVPAPSAAAFTLGALSVQAKGSEPVPEIFAADGTRLSADDFDTAYAGKDEAGIAVVTVTGRAGTDYAGQSASLAYEVSARANPATFTWAACADGNFEDDSKWSVSTGEAGHPELADDIVVLPKFVSDSSYTVTAIKPFTIGALTVGDVNGAAGNCKATMVFKTGDAASRVAGDLTVKQNGMLTHYGPAATQTDVLNLRVGGDCTVEADGAIHADSKGYSGGSGSGPGGAAQGNAASHAGQGKGAKGGPYGSVLRPVTWGSNTAQNTGGGAIHLEVAGTLTVNGRVSANGATGNVNYTSCGGSVWIECDALVGTGCVEAKDGLYTSTSPKAQYTSSGGRIAVYQRTATDFTAFPVTQMATVQHGLNAAGTIYLESAGGRDLYVIGGARDAPQKTPFPMPDDGNDLTQYADLNVHVSGYAHLSVCDLKMPAMTLPIRSIEVVNKAIMTIGAGSVLQVSGDVDLTGAKAASVAGGGWLEFVGGDAASFRGAAVVGALGGIVCTNAGKVIRFGTAAADKLTIGTGMDFVVKGAEGAPVTLVSTAEGESWFISMHANPGVVEVDHVAVQDSDASSGAPMLAISSQNLGNNANWGFSNPIVPGETITWTGVKSAKWDAIENWDLGRAPVETDRIVIPADVANAPTLPSGSYLFNAIAVPAGAALTLAGGCALTVTNDLTVAGALIFTGGEDLYLAGNASFFGGTVTKAGGKIHLVGAGDQTVDFGGNILFKVYGEKPSGNVSFGSHGFTADAFTCAASAPITYTFAAGATYTVPALSLSSIGADRQITLASSVPGTAWKLVTSASDQSVAGVEAHDCDASDGATVMAGTKSVATDNCTNWDTVTSIAAWLGGSGDWMDPAKWSTGEVPSETESVMVSAADGETLTLTVPAGADAVMKSLTLKAGAGGKATLLAKSGLTVEADLDVLSGAVLVMDAYDDGGEAPNLVKGNVRVRNGGVITHSGPANAQNARVHLKVLGNFTVDAGGAVDVNGKGYNAKMGPVGNTYGNCFGSGHAGYGYKNPKMPYGSILHPITWGSASNNNPAGGAIRLDIGGTLTVNGEIRADGFYSNDAYSHAGGSVWIDCAALVGTGYIYAREGWRTSWVASNQTTSSGGRIAIYQHAAENFDAFPKSRIITNRQEQNSAGTVYLECVGAAGGADLYVVGSTKNTTLQTSFPMPDDGDPLQYTNVNVHVGASAVLYVCDQMPGAKVAVRSLTVTDSGRVQFAAGTGLLVRETLDATGTGDFNCAGTGYVEFGGDGEGVLLGAKKIANLGGLVCTNAGKVIRFGTGENDAPVIAAGKSLVLKGEDENPVTLLPLEGAATWKIDVDANASVDVRCVAVSNSTSVSASISAVSSHDLGGNEKWAFIAEIVPGEEIVWTGAKSTDWMDPLNWDRGRNPVLTDTILVNALGDGANYPTLGGGVFAFEQISVGSGASFTLDACDLTISNKLTVAGTLVFAGAERLRLVRDADFTDGQVVKGGSTVSLEGGDSQIVDFDGVVLRCLNIAKPGGVVVMNGDLTASILRCDAASPLELQFAEGVTFDIADLYLNGGEKNLTLKGIDAGGSWNLKATADSQCVTGVKVSGCTATGATIYAGQNSSDDGGNVNWDFAAETAVWLGASGDWTDATHWSLGAVPSAGTQVLLNVGEGSDVTITIPKASAASVASLDVRAADGGKAKIVANGTLAVAEDAHVRANGVLELNGYDDAGEAPNVIGGDLVVHAGGRVSHTGPADSVNAKLHLKVAGDVTVEEGGSIDADSKGHRPNKGPSSANTNCESAGYAGYGHSPDSARSIDSHTSSHKPYGSIFRPTDWGSSGNASSAGGAVHLVVGGTLTVNGAVSADCSNYHGDYASSGGSVWIECAAIVGTGRVSAREGDSKRANASQGYQRLCDCASSGGRIAIYQTVAKSFDAFPISRISTVRNGYNAVGTVYLESADTGAGTWLYLQTDENIRHKTKFPMEQDGDPATAFRNVNVVVKGESLLAVESDVTVRDLRCEASDTAGKNVPHVYLNGKTLKIRSMKHVNGRKWFKGYEAAIESGHVVLGGTALNPGKIEWIGGATGMMLMVK